MEGRGKWEEPTRGTGQRAEHQPGIRLWGAASLSLCKLQAGPGPITLSYLPLELIIAFTSGLSHTPVKLFPQVAPPQHRVCDLHSLFNKEVRGAR